MKTKELIRRLQEEDPSGEEEVVVGNLDIHFIEHLPAYYDGAAQQLIRDENNKYYNIIGAKYRRSGNKIQIHTLSILDALDNETESHPLVIDYSELPTDRQESTRKAHEQYRQIWKDIKQQNERTHFVRWVKDQAAALTADTDSLPELAKNFFEKQKLSYTDPLPDGKVLPGKSYNDTRCHQWSKRFEVYLDQGFLAIKERTA